MWQSLKGCVIIRCNGQRPERLLNGLREAGIPAGNIVRGSGGEITLAIPAGDFSALRPIVRKSGCRVHILRRFGIPFFLYRCRRRPVLLVGAMLLLGILAFSSTRILHIRIVGCERVPENVVLRALSGQGVEKLGKKPRETNLVTIGERARAYDERLAWIALSLKGSVLQVDVTEAEKEAVLPGRSAVCDIVAVKDGVILDIDAYDGMAAVQPGQQVRAGDVLIQGVYMTQTNEIFDGVVRTHARGTVLASVYYSAEAAVEAEAEQTADSGNTAPYRAVKLFGRILSQTDPPFAAYEVRELTETPVADCMLPITLVEGTIYERTQRMTALTREEKRELALYEAEMAAFLKIPKDAGILQKSYQYFEQDDVVICVVSVITSESIGLEKEISA